MLLLSFILFLFSCGSNNNTSNTTNIGSNNADTSAAMYKPVLLMTLPEDSCNTPDGLAINKDSNLIVLSTPNLNKPRFTPPIYPIVNLSLQPFVDLPVSADTKHVAPVNLAFGPDGNLYINDNLTVYLYSLCTN